MPTETFPTFDEALSEAPLPKFEEALDKPPLPSIDEALDAGQMQRKLEQRSNMVQFQIGKREADQQTQANESNPDNYGFDKEGNIVRLTDEQKRSMAAMKEFDNSNALSGHIKGAKFLGKLIWGTGADLTAKQESDKGENVLAAINEPTSATLPIDKQLAELPTVAGAITRGIGSVVKSAPVMAAGLPAGMMVGVPAAFATEAYQDTDEPLRAAQAAATALLFPAIGKLLQPVGTAASQALVKAGAINIENTAAQKSVETIVHQAGFNAAAQLTMLPEYAQMKPEERLSAFIESTVANTVFSLPDALNIAGARRIDKAIAKAVEDSIRTHAQEVARTSGILSIPEGAEKAPLQPNVREAEAKAAAPQGVKFTGAYDDDQSGTPNPKMASAAMKILLRRGVEPDVAERFGRWFTSKRGGPLDETFRADLNREFDASGLKSNREANTYSSSLEALEQNGITGQDAVDHITKHSERKAEIEAENQRILDGRGKGETNVGEQGAVAEVPGTKPLVVELPKGEEGKPTLQETPGTRPLETDRQEAAGIIAGSAAEAWADKVLAVDPRAKTSGLLALIDPVEDPKRIAAVTVKAAAMLERGVRRGAEFTDEMVKTFGEGVRPHLDGILKTIDSQEFRQSLYTPSDADLTAMGQSASVAQLPALVAVAERLTKAGSRAANNRFLRKEVIEPNAARKESEQAGPASSYLTLQEDALMPPSLQAGSRKAAYDNVSRFDQGADTNLARAKARLTKLNQELEALQSRTTDATSRRDIADALPSIFKTQGRQAIRDAITRRVKEAAQLVAGTREEVTARAEIAEARAALSASRAALGNSEGVKKSLEYIARNLDFSKLDPILPNVDRITTSAQMVKELQGTADPADFAQAVGAPLDTFQTVARVVLASEPLRKTLFDLKDVARAGEPFAALQKALRASIKAGDINAAIRVMESGVGRTAAERALSAKAARLLLNQERRIMDAMQAEHETVKAIEEITNSPEYKQMRKKVLGDMGVRNLFFTNNGSEIHLIAVKQGDPDVVLPLNTAVGSTREMLSRAQKWKAEALAYLAKPDAPGYNPKRAAGLWFVLERYDGLFNAGVLPASGRQVPGALTSITRGAFVALGSPELIPMWVKRYGAGLAVDVFARTENALSTASKVIESTYEEHKPRLIRSAKAAMTAHGFKHPEDYVENVLNHLLASRQDFRSTPLKVGDEIGNGYKVRGSDAEYINSMIAFEKSLYRKLTATARENYASIANDPIGVLFKDAKGDVSYRLPEAMGPNVTNRRLDTAMAWATAWRENSIDRAIILADNPRILFSYVADAGNGAFKFPYKYATELKEVFAEMKAGKLLEGFDDLVNRVTDKLSDRTSDEGAVVKEIVAGELMGELTTLLKRIDPETGKQTVAEAKAEVEMFGGSHQFNTERGAQVVPSGWYDYGEFTTPQFISAKITALDKFSLAHLRSAQTVVKTLSEKVAYMERTGRSPSEKDVVGGLDFYTLGQAREAKAYFSNYLKQLERTLKNYSADAGANETPRVIRATLDYNIASWLASPGVGAANLIGAVKALWHFNMTFAGQGFTAAGVNALSQAGLHGYRYALSTLAHDNNPVGRKIYQALTRNQATPIVGIFARHFARQVDITRALYDQSRRDGLIQQRDAASLVKSMMDFVVRQQSIEPTRGTSMAQRAGRRYSTAVRTLGRAITRIPIQAIDDFANTMAAQQVVNFRRDLEKRALLYGEGRVNRAAATGTDPFDVANPGNRFSDRELVGSNKFLTILTKQIDPAGSALRIRNMVRQSAGVDLDAAMWDFYQRVKAAEALEKAEGKPDGEYTANERLFTEDQLRQLKFETAEHTNLATLGSRPIGGRTGPVGRTLSPLLGYSGFSLEEWLSAMNRINTRTTWRGYAWTLPLIAGLVASSAALGAGIVQPILNELREWWKGTRSSIPTVYTAQTPADAVKAFMAGWGAVTPLFGTALNIVGGMSFRGGYNLDSQFAVVNIASDIMRTVKASFEMGDATYPAIRFAERNIFPATFLAQFMPQYEGLKEMGNARNDLILGARGTGLETLVRKGNNSLPTYTEISPLLFEFSNAAGKGDNAGAQAAHQKIVAYWAAKGSQTPERDAIKSEQSKNPVVAAFGTRPTDEQLATIMGNLPADRRTQLQSTLRNFDRAVQAVGGNPVTFAKREAVGGSSFGGFGGSGSTRRSGRTRRVGRGGRRTTRRVGRTRRGPTIRARRSRVRR